VDDFPVVDVRQPFDQLPHKVLHVRLERYHVFVYDGLQIASWGTAKKGDTFIGFEIE